MISMNTNIQALIVQKNLLDATFGLNNSIERMTTGYKINRSKDDAAGFSISTKMAGKLSSFNVAYDNAEIGLSYLNTAEGNLDLVSEHLIRIRDLTEQAANGTYSSSSRQSIQAEINERIAEINRVLETAEFNGSKIFEGSDAAATAAAFAIQPQTFATHSTSSEGYFISDPISYTDAEVTAMTTMTEAVANNSLVSGGTYSISTVDELVALANYVNAGNSASGMTFVLGDDIDLSSISNWTPIGDYSTDSSYKFKGTFNGNGQLIKNLTIDNETKGYQGLFGFVSFGSIKNVGIEGGSVKGDSYVGGLVAEGFGATISNCYATGTVSGEYCTGGLVGQATGDTISNSYATGVVSGKDWSAGLVGSSNNSNLTIDNCYATGSVKSSMGRVAGLLHCESPSVQTNSYATGSITGILNIYGVTNSDDWDGTYFTYSVASYSGNPGYLSTAPEGGTIETPEGSIGFFVGIQGVASSMITVDTRFAFALDVDVSTSESAHTALSEIDDWLKEVNAMQTNIGTTSNRLESVLDSINTSIENLTSSLSTMRDADIAKESTNYLQKQILQNACATLLSTANQTPSIALSLIRGV